MSFAMSDAAANAVLDAEPTLYAALSSTAVQNNGSGLNEPAQADYVRPAVSFAAASGRARTTNAVADFVNGGGNAAATAGSFSYFALMTAASGGTVRWKGQLQQAVAWTVGQPVEIAVGNITIGLPGA